jgi:diguanylate cyclase (GGDEF)-like protein
VAGFSGTCALLLLMEASPYASAAVPTIVVDAPDATYDLQPGLEVREGPGAEEWSAQPSLDRASGRRVYCGRLRIRSRLAEPAQYVLVPGQWEHVDLYPSGPDERGPIQRSGWSVPLPSREVWSATPALRVTLQPETTQTLYLRFESDFDAPDPPRDFALRLSPWASFFRAIGRARTLQGVYAGLVLGVVLYNLLLFFSVRDRTYLLYVLYAFSFGFIWTAKRGLAFEVLWPSLPRWDLVSTFYLIALAVVCGNRFVAAFLETGRHVRRLDRALRLLSAGAVAAVVLRLLGPWRAAEQLLALVSLAACVVYVAAGVMALRRGYLPARTYLAASGVLIAGTAAYVLHFLGLLPEGFLTLHGPQVGSALEVVVLAVALGDRINVLRREKEAAEAAVRRGLELEVQERTADLTRQNDALEQARQEAEGANRQLQEQNARLTRISFFDQLTGVSNRRHFEAVLDAEWRRCARTGQPLAVLLIDVDYFKSYNDHFGHLAGDECLRRVAGALARGSRRAGDFVARFGGEEFVVVLPDTNDVGAGAKAEALRRAVEAMKIPQAPAAALPVVTISVGVAGGWPDVGGTPSSIVAEADRALYTAKHKGRNRVAPPQAGRAATGSPPPPPRMPDRVAPPPRPRRRPSR